MKHRAFKFSLFFFTFLSLSLARSGDGASLPQATQDLLKKTGVAPSFLDDIDKELNVPKQWIEGGKKEGVVRYVSGKRPMDKRKIFAPFTERYPFISVDYSSVGHEARAIKTIVAYRAGRVVADMLDSVGGNVHNFQEAGALEDLRDIPNARLIPEELKDKEGGWIGFNLAYYCLAYNERLVKQNELPKRWEDLIADPRWRSGKLAIANRPSLGPVHLWKGKGEQWTRGFFTRLFNEVKPQLRKESLNALLELLAAGEFQMIFPAGVGTVSKVRDRGAPISVVCPELVLGNVNELVVVKGGNVHAAKLLVNWLLSKEGQLSFYEYNEDIPMREDVRDQVKLQFQDEVRGKRIVVREPGVAESLMTEVETFWNNLWLSSGGKPR